MFMRFQAHRGLKLIKGEGQYVWDSEGRKYLDAHTGHGAAFLGHRPGKVVDAIKEQLDKLMVASTTFSTDVIEECLSSLSKILPSGLNNVYFQNSGAEAVELALKLAFKITGRRGLLSFKNGFHGRTLGALSVTWNREYREGLPLLKAEFGEFNDISSTDLINDETAAVILEPVQGEGGIEPSRRDFLVELRRACDEVGAVLIFDEVQCGFGRTGFTWAHQSRGVEPDILIAGKSIASGFPISVVAARDWIIEGLRAGFHGSTHGGNPLACAALKASIELFLEENVPEAAREMGKSLASMISEYAELKGEGLMLGVRVKQPSRVLRSLQASGVLALKAGEDMVRLLPPYCITEEDCSFLSERLRRALSEQGS